MCGQHSNMFFKKKKLRAIVFVPIYIRSDMESRKPIAQLLKPTTTTNLESPYIWFSWSFGNYTVAIFARKSLFSVPIWFVNVLAVALERNNLQESQVCSFTHFSAIIKSTPNTVKCSYFMHIEIYIDLDSREKPKMP